MWKHVRGSYSRTVEILEQMFLSDCGYTFIDVIQEQWIHMRNRYSRTVETLVYILFNDIDNTCVVIIQGQWIHVHIRYSMTVETHGQTFRFNLETVVHSSLTEMTRYIFITHGIFCI